MYSLLRILKFAFQDIARNLTLSVMTVLILVLMLLSVKALLIIRVLTNEATALVREQIDVSIFFDNQATEEEIAEVRATVAQFPEVTGSDYFSREQVLEQFRLEHADNPDIVASLEELGENPLGPTLVVKTRDPKDYQKIIDALRVPEFENIIEAKTFGDTEAAIERIDTITTQVERLGLLLSALFTVIAFFIIFNTIRVSIYTQRAEISIKKLVGATNWFVRGPYLFESLVFAAASVAIASGLVILAARVLDPYVAVVFEQSGILTGYYNSHILLLLGGEFGAVLLLTVFSTLLAMRKHLRV